MRRLKFSIVIPSLNQGRFLERALESVRSQQYPEVECLVYDDGSTDNSGLFGSMRMSFIFPEHSMRLPASSNPIRSGKCFVGQWPLWMKPGIGCGPKNRRS